MNTVELLLLMGASNFAGVVVALAGGWLFYRIKDRRK